MAVEILKPITVVATLLYSTLGVVIFWLSFIIIDKITPYDLWKEIVEERNVALATIVAAMCLGIAIIVAAAIH
jgi:putative membrane protein